MEDYAYVLDVLPEGRPDSKRRFRREPLVYGLGIEEFKIFDMQPVAGAAINIGDKCYIGKETEDRTQIDHVRARVNYSDLTHTAQSELSFVLDEIVKDNEEKFIQFYNHAGPISRPDWEIYPDLPASLSFNLENGTITGTPDELFDFTNYTIYANASSIPTTPPDSILYLSLIHISEPTRPERIAFAVISL